MKAGILIGVIMWLLLAGAVTALTGCSAGSNVKASVAGANIEIAKAKSAALTKPLVDMVIPMQGCTPVVINAVVLNDCMMRIVLRSPGSGGTGDYVPNPDDPWARVAERAVGGLVTAGGIWLGGQAAANIVEAGAEGIVNALKANPAPTIVVQPPPVIVPPADPVIVTQPAPLVVDPVIVMQPAPLVSTQFGP